MSFTEGRKDPDNAECYLDVVRSVIEEARRKGVSVNFINGELVFENNEYAENKEAFKDLIRIPRRFYCTMKFKNYETTQDPNVGKEYSEVYDKYQEAETERYRLQKMIDHIQVEMDKVNLATEGVSDQNTMSDLVNQVGKMIQSINKINKILEGK